jgi:hypothetical protein
MLHAVMLAMTAAAGRKTGFGVKAEERHNQR